MTKTMTKTVFSMAFLVTAFALVGCTPQYTKDRDPGMKLSTPPMIETNPPTTEMSVPGGSVDPNHRSKNMMMSTPSMVMQPTMAPPPVIVEAPAAPETGSNVQMLGQPGMGPADMNPSSEIMPDMHVTTDESYPHPSC